ncbi:hypothetical protein SAMN05216299_12617 [Nitrosospira sp. Nsp14]|nr:hypothetical protein SAMN05216299_12617 [Nitrosospira sp. Nsp14]
MNKLTPHPDIQHLSSAEKETLMEKYVSGAKVSDLVREFNIKCTPSQLWSRLPPRVLEHPCPVCGSVMVQDLPSRSSYRSSPKIHCSACDHEEGNRCRCKHCQEQRTRAAAEEEARRQALITQAMKAERDRYVCSSYSVDALPLSLGVAFLAFYRCCPINKKGLYDPLEANPVPFAPAEYGSTLLDLLRKSGLISISEHSPVGSIFHQGSQVTFTAEKVCWTGDIDKNLKLAEDIEDRALTGNWPEHWYAEVEENWLNLALAECKEFYDYCLDERKLHVQGDEAIKDMLRNILRDFSVGQCYNIIWQGARNAADFLVRRKTNHTHAGNFMAGACQRAADTARAEGYAVKNFRRNFELPRSMISYVLCDVIFKIGERGFTERIGLEALARESENLW